VGELEKILKGQDKRIRAFYEENNYEKPSSSRSLSGIINEKRLVLEILYAKKEKELLEMERKYLMEKAKNEQG